MKINEILSQLGKDILTEEVKTAIAEAFESAVNEKATERVKVEVETALSKLDEEHTSKFSQLLEAIDKDHTAKVVKVVQKINEDHLAKLQEVQEKYNKTMKNEAEAFRNKLVEQMSNYIDLYIDKAIPAKTIAEAVENTQAKKLIDEIKKIVAVDESFITDNIREALKEGKEMIDSLRNELNESIKENVKLNQEIKNVKASLVLEQKVAQLSDKKKSFVMRVLKNKSPEYIEENFKYVTEMFEKDQKDEVEILKEEAIKETKSLKIDVPPAVKEEPIIKESNGYLTALQSLER